MSKEKLVSKDFSIINEIIEDILNDADERNKNIATVKNFVAIVEKEYAPTLEEITGARIPLYAFKHEITAARIIYEAFMKLAQNPDPKIQSVIAATIERHHMLSVVNTFEFEEDDDGESKKGDNLEEGEN